MKTCNKCKKEKQTSDFGKAKGGKGGLRSHCKTCVNEHNREQYKTNGRKASKSAWYKDNPEKARAYSIKKKWKLTVEEYETLLARGCETCGATEDLCIDHNHNCCPTHNKTCGNCIRGVLCGKCNKAEGLLRSDPEIIKNLLAYVIRYGD